MRRWSGIVSREGVQTGDGRVFVDGAFYWDAADFPLPLRWCPQDDGWHDGAVVVGSIETLERQDGGIIFGTGMLDDTEDTPGAEAARLMDEGLLRGVSVDPDDWQVQVIDTTVDPSEVDDLEELIEMLLASAGDPDPGEEGGVVVYEEAAGEFLERYLRSRIRAATLVDIPAFSDAIVALDPVGTDAAAVAASADCVPCERERAELAALAAGGAPLYPSAAWFADPQFTRADVVVDPLDQRVMAVPLQVTDEGRVFGHIAPWGQCHTGSAMGECVLTPKSRTSYAYFLTGSLRTAEGSDVCVGQLTLGGGHAPLHLSYRGAIEHYDNVGSAMADVACGEDEFGIWVAGALRPDVTPENIRKLRASPPSGDWRPIRGSLEMIACHSVNSQGLPIARLVASGCPVALVAAGARQMARLATVSERDADALAAMEERLSARIDAIGERLAVSATIDELDVGDSVDSTGKPWKRLPVSSRQAAIDERAQLARARSRLAALREGAA